MARSIKNYVPKLSIPKGRPRMPDWWSADADEPEEFEEMTLQEHLEEFRDRIIRVFIGLVPAFIFGFIIHKRVIAMMLEKAQVSTFDIRSPVETMTLTFKVSAYIAVAIMLPWIVYQLIAFLAPGMTRKEKRFLYLSLPFVTILLVSGMVYAWVVAIPRSMWFLSRWNEGLIDFEGIDANETTSLFLLLIMGLGIAFQLPLVIFILAKLGVASPAKLRQWRKYAYLILLILSAVLTPTTDPFNLALVAVPMVILYELGIILGAIFARTTVSGATNAGAVGTQSEGDKPSD